MRGQYRPGSPERGHMADHDRVRRDQGLPPYGIAQYSQQERSHHENPNWEYDTFTGRRLHPVQTPRETVIAPSSSPQAGRVPATPRLPPQTPKKAKRSMMKALFAPATPCKSTLMNMLTMMVTVAVLVAGFSLAVASSVQPADVRSYVEWEVGMFVGRNSGLCEAIKQRRPFALDEKLAGACDASNCFVRGTQWGDHCSITDPNDIKQFRELQAEIKLVQVQKQLGGNAMICIWLESLIVVVGGMMMYSLSCQVSDEEKSEAVARWSANFGLLSTIMYMLTFYGFYKFIKLSQRVIKIKFNFCDDDLTDQCMVDETWWWYFWSALIPGLVLLILILHIRVTTQNFKTERSSQPGSARVPSMR